jgi:hypothetical protein
MQYALQALWDLWVESKGETNNLRLFADGTLVDPSDVGVSSILFSFYVQRLKKWDRPPE